MKFMLTIASILLFSIVMPAQHLEVIGKAKVTDMDKDNTADSVVVRLADGTLGVRDKLTLSQNLPNPINDQDAVTKAYVDLLEHRLNLLQNTLEAGGLIEDVDGNFYNTVKIGTQVWMAENLRTTKYSNGDTIPYGIDFNAWTNASTPFYCWYDNDSMSYAKLHGALYNFFTVADSNNRNVCPVGWHVPDTTEWNVLINNLGDVFISGGKMKESGTVHWSSPNDGATNESGFTGLPSGYRDPGGGYFEIGDKIHFWPRTEANALNGYTRHLFYDNSHFDLNNEQKQFGFAVRCLKD